MVWYTPATPDPHCFCTANGPYAEDLPYDHEDETGWAIEISWLTHAFPKGLKTAVLAQNNFNNGGVYKSDAKLTDAAETIFDPEPDLQTDNYLEGNAAQIDHIIPRKDSKGCRCGEPTPNNAAVISRQLNETMSNTSPLFDENRAKMFEKYVTCPRDVDARFTGRTASLVCGEDLGERSQIDEATVDPDFEVPRTAAAKAPEPGGAGTGGCSASGLAGLGVALALGGLRRRRSRGARGRGTDAQRRD